MLLIRLQIKLLRWRIKGLEADARYAAAAIVRETERGAASDAFASHLRHRIAHLEQTPQYSPTPNDKEITT
jgi:hypothetical protein